MGGRVQQRQWLSDLKDVLAPGDLDASVSGPEVLTLTTTGHLSLQTAPSVRRSEG